MRKLTLSVVAVAVLLMCASSSQAAAMPNVTIALLNPPPHDLLELAVGESHTFDVQITSDQPFVVAMALTDQYYPGRGIYWHGSDQATQATSALLQLTMTGKKPTADLAAVCDWPGPGECWPEGVAPVSIAVGVRFKGGRAVGERFNFAVVVP